MLANQQVEAITLALATVLAPSKKSDAINAEPPKSAQELEAGLKSLFR